MPSCDGLDQRVREQVGPRPRRFGEPGLQRFEIDFGNAATLGVDDHMQPGEDLVAHLGREAGAVALESRGENVLQLAAQRGVVAGAWHVDHAGHETLEGIAAHEESGALTFLQVQHADRDLVEVLDGDLEELVARIVLEDVQKRLAVVASWR